MIKLFDMDAKLHRHGGRISEIIQDVLDSGNFIQGGEVEKFESNWADYTGAKSCVAVANATDGLEIALKALGVGFGHKVITVANAGYYSTAAILNVGAIPVYIDVDSETFNMDTELFINLGFKEAKCIVITHLYGLPVLEILKLVEYCRANQILVIEDCSQSHGTRLDGKHVGTFGDIGVFSFYPTKNLGALGDAGCLITNEFDLFQKIRKIRNYGWGSKYNVEIPGGRNSRMDEIQAAILNYFLLDFESQISLRKQKAQIYRENLDNSLVDFQLKHASNSYHLFVIKVGNRDKIMFDLKDRKIETAIHFPIPDHLQKANSSKHIKLPVTEKLSKEILTLPFYPEIPTEIIKYVCESVNNSNIHQ